MRVRSLRIIVVTSVISIGILSIDPLDVGGDVHAALGLGDLHITTGFESAEQGLELISTDDPVTDFLLAAGSGSFLIHLEFGIDLRGLDEIHLLLLSKLLILGIIILEVLERGRDRRNVITGLLSSLEGHRLTVVDDNDGDSLVEDDTVTLRTLLRLLADRIVTILAEGAVREGLIDLVLKERTDGTIGFLLVRFREDLDLAHLRIENVVRGCELVLVIDIGLFLVIILVIRILVAILEGIHTELGGESGAILVSPQVIEVPDRHRQSLGCIRHILSTEGPGRIRVGGFRIPTPDIITVTVSHTDVIHRLQAVGSVLGGSDVHRLDREGDFTGGGVHLVHGSDDKRGLGSLRSIVIAGIDRTDIEERKDTGNSQFLEFLTGERIVSHLIS